MALSTTFNINVVSTFTSLLDLTTVTDPLNIADTQALGTGTGANQADLLWHDQRSLSADAGVNLDLNGATLQDAFGNNLAFARIKGLYVKNNDTVTTLSIGGASSNQWLWLGGATETVVLRPGGVFLLWAAEATAYPVTAGTGDLLRIFRGSGTITNNTFDIAIIGASA